MPNWCSQNCFLRGDKKELEEFASLVNSLPEREPAAETDFGPFWLGNIVAALGKDWNAVQCRGVIDANDEAPACFCLCEPDDDQRLSVCEDACGHYMTFTLHHAWSPAYDVMNILKEKWPSFKFGYKATDDMGNFSCCHLIEGFDVPKYEIYIPDFCEIATDDERVAVTAMLSAAGIENMDYDKLSFGQARELIDDWLEENDIYPDIIEWEEE